jgi:hypothetical protein
MTTGGRELSIGNTSVASGILPDSEGGFQPAGMTWRMIRAAADDPRLALDIPLIAAGLEACHHGGNGDFEGTRLRNITGGASVFLVNLQPSLNLR